jgi:hydrogenase maturation factor
MPNRIPLFDVPARLPEVLVLARMRLARLKPRLGGPVLVSAIALSTASLAAAQAHEVRQGPYVLRSTTVASDRIDADTAKRHGIQPSPGRAVLNVVLLKNVQQEGQTTVPAQVKAISRNLAGVRNEIELQEVRENGRVSYLGSYEFLPREVFDFHVTAQPEGKGEPTLSLAYRERMWSR